MIHQQLTLFDSGRPSQKQRPGSGALRLYWFLRGVSCGKAYCYPKQKFLQDRLRRTRQTIYRWIKELVKFGLLEIVRRGRDGLSNLYKFTVLLSSTKRKPVTKNVTLVGPVSTIQSTTRPPSGGEQTPLIAQKVAEYFGDAVFGGKHADPGLIARISRIVRNYSGLERFQQYYWRWRRKGNRQDGWGIFVTLAEDAARELFAAPKISPRPKPVDPPQQQPPDPAAERRVLVGLGINPDQFALGRR